MEYMEPPLIRCLYTVACMRVDFLTEADHESVSPKNTMKKNGSTAWLESVVHHVLDLIDVLLGRLVKRNRIIVRHSEILIPMRLVSALNRFRPISIGFIFLFFFFIILINVNRNNDKTDTS